jgi:hypothetical protein
MKKIKVCGKLDALQIFLEKVTITNQQPSLTYTQQIAQPKWMISSFRLTLNIHFKVDKKVVGH